jgi:hypothetical protein
MNSPLLARQAMKPLVTPLVSMLLMLPLQELMAIQQSDGPKNIGFFGTRNMGVTHQKLVEVLSYAYASTVSRRGTAGRRDRRMLEGVLPCRNLLHGLASILIAHHCELPLVQGNHIYTSGATGTNAAVIKGALRANCPDKLTVILPQSLKRQPSESQDLLIQVGGKGGQT